MSPTMRGRRSYTGQIFEAANHEPWGHPWTMKHTPVISAVYGL